MLRGLYRNNAIRRIAIPLLRRMSPGDIRIRHHHTGAPVLLDAFRHKGYWFHGRRREAATMELFRQLLKPGDYVVEVGGHIGYLSLFFADLVGDSGRVEVFEPGGNNLPYLQANTKKLANITIFEQAVSDDDGIAIFFEEGLTGQNNSLDDDYDEFEENRKRAHVEAEYTQREVESVKLDTHLSDRAAPTLVKVDIEGAEALALAGAVRVLRTARPVVMVEVTRREGAVFDLLRSRGYCCFSESGVEAVSADELHGNVFAMHPDAHSELIRRLGWSKRVAA